MLLNWQVSATAGAKLIFAIDERELEPFKLLTRKEGKRPGQRLMAVFVPIGEDEKPIPVPRGPLFILSARWCGDDAFFEWVTTEWPSFASEAIAENSDGGDYLKQIVAAAIVKRVCGIKSRKALDTNPEAAKEFNLRIRGPYMEHLQCLPTR